MSVSDDIRKVVLHEEFRICELCGYDRGFQTSLIRISAGHRHFRCILVCPECGTRYDVKWIIDLI